MWAPQPFNSGANVAHQNAAFRSRRRDAAPVRAADLLTTSPSRFLVHTLDAFTACPVAYTIGRPYTTVKTSDVAKAAHAHTLATQDKHDMHRSYVHAGSSLARTVRHRPGRTLCAP